jgi:Family of unknown function (DUF6516)
MTARDYYRSVLQLLTTATVVTNQRIEFDEQDVDVAYLKGAVDLIDGSTLFFAQYVQIVGAGSSQITRKKYRYHWQAPSGEMRYRWDNARHYPGLATFPDHVHIGPEEEAQESGPTDLWYVIGQIERAI